MRTNRVILRCGKALALLLTLALLTSSALGNTLAFIVTGTSSLLNIFVSGLDPTGNLTIRKTLAHPFGEDYVLPEDLYFPFQVDLGEQYAGKTLSTSNGDVQADESGTVELRIPAGAAVTIHDIDTDTQARITELLSTGFSVDNGDNPRTVAISRRGTETVFANVYKPNPLEYLNVRISGTKTLVGRDWQEGDIFTFILEQESKTDDGTEWIRVGTSTVTYELVEMEDPANPGQTILAPKANFNVFDLTQTLQSLDYERAGTYCFRLSEEFGHVGGVTYDSVVSYFDVVVGDADMDGYLEVQSVLGYQNANADYDAETDHFLVEVSVENTYAPAGVAPCAIQIRKQVVTDSGTAHSPAGFTFELYDETGALVAVTDPTSAAGEAFISMTFEAEQAGKTFYYTLKETHGGETHNGMIYDSAVYPLAITVIDNLDGTVRAAVYQASPGETEVPEEAESVLRLTFTNRYDPMDTEAVLGGFKELTGRALRDGEFTFCLYRTNADFSLEDTAEPVRTARNTAEGTFAFDTLSYDRVGHYYYVVTERSSEPLSGVHYDNARFHVTVTVSDTGGALAAVVSITDQLGSETDIRFRNHYRAAGTSAVFGGVKRFDGAKLEAGMFSFDLYEADAQFNIRGVLLDKAFNAADGSFSFRQIHYDTPGNYYYVMREDDSAPIEGVTYDHTQYGITVQVTDDGNGKLKETVTIHVLGGGKVSAAVFENSYVEPTEPTDPTVPTVPTDPTDPTEPTVPTDPTEPTVPTDPTDPTDPTVPTAPTEPSVPTEPTDPSKPTEPDGPDTGDSAGKEFHVVALVTCLLLMVLLLVMAEDHDLTPGKKRR